MLNYIPDLRLAAELSAQSGPEDKLGGIPWGLSADAWPVCSSCGKSQSLLAQFVHHPERLNLGRAGRVLSVFQCNHDPGCCPTWEGGSGANACFVTEPEALLDRLSSLPADKPIVEREARIVDWVAREDDVQPEQVRAYFSETELWKLHETVRHELPSSTRLGGVPYWVQSADEAPQDGWRFVGQLDSWYSFLRPPSVSDPEIREDANRSEGRSHFCEGPNFGDAGIAYLFLRNTSGTPEGWFFWQCG